MSRREKLLRAMFCPTIWLSYLILFLERGDDQTGISLRGYSERYRLYALAPQKKDSFQEHTDSHLVRAVIIARLILLVESR